MKKEIYIQIPEPCHEDWGKMSPVQQGRYCQSCSKDVVDFSLMSDQEIIQFLSKPRGKTCGNFATDQLDRIIKEPATPAKKKYWAVMFSFMLPLLVSIKSQAQFRKKRTVAQVTDTKMELRGEPMVVASDTTPVIKGKVTDEDGSLLEGVTVKIKGKEDKTITNNKGEFTLPFKGKEIVLMIALSGYTTQQLTVYSGEASKEQTIILQGPEKRLLGKIAVKAAPQTQTECKVEMQFVQGKVVDESGNPIASAVIQRSPKNGTIADINGVFSLSVPAGKNKLIVSAIGFKDKEIIIPTDRKFEINIVLEKSTQFVPTEVTFIITSCQIKRTKFGSYSASEIKQISTLTIKGRITDSALNPIPFATVLIKGTHKGTTSDANGYYRLTDIKPNDFSLSVSSLGYKNYDVFVPAARSAELERDIVLTPQINMLEAVILPYRTTNRRGCGYSVGMYRITSEKISIIQKVTDTITNVFKPFSFKVYPNPASKNEFVNVRLLIPATYQLRLTDNEGKLILQNSFTISAKSQAYQLELPSTIAAGIYFINVIDEKSKKQYTQKLIVQ